MTYDLEGKVVLITGAAGGIGSAAARELYLQGASLVLTDTRQETVDELAREFDDRRVLPLVLDVTDAEAAKAVVRQAVERFGRLDVAFANAGIAWAGVPATLRVCDEAEFRRIVEVDLFGVWHTLRAALPEIVRNRGQVLITSSIYAFMNGMANAPYAASKAAVESLGRALRAELSTTGASASVLYPGWTDTAIAKVAFGGNFLVTRMNESGLPAFLRRPIPPAQVARAVVHGLQRRRPRIVVPARWAPIALMRGLLNVLVDWRLPRDERLQRLLLQLEDEAVRSQAQDRGDPPEVRP
ncbi:MULTISPECIES: SDR family NAD(P)-dependent oxidoreductase [unclassified Pseudomonas]|uniref:SDR family NAD(P)-dependent oxidoreductase n=1 Tax=unclassified Pseudomonas TaxID=196821 RepID=UPI00244A1C09|nr:MULTISPECIES: SDR family NAD(P)-dependent oxidoreductase [unclassified Pseudomonas]MDG9930413.1 SDR family NAD(P)-dependent oxidoreductase [Pseudomonas sp. GD04042]MDH0483037.1 SDR family NAD(P)-dependent oxidoreductase [Pseudomonas sp. GD04015]MDH0605437.1 SDR family NAD(P)-dependent oxidoreductase [Pseudomonas sp. GD03869]